MLQVPRVRESLKSQLLQPLHADLFLAVSPSWAGKLGHDDLNNPETEHAHIFALTVERLLAIQSDLHPVSTVVARDGQMLRVLSQLAGPRDDEMREVFACAKHQPLPSRIEKNNMEDGGDGYAWRRSHYQLGPCSPQISLALRYRTCLSLIERAERRRGALYTWVVRSRPDISLPCTLSFHIFHPKVSSLTDLRNPHD